MSNDQRDPRRAPIGRRRFLTTVGAASAVALAAPALGRAQAREVKVGYMLPVTGPLAFEAQLALNGLLLAVDEINGAGGIKSLGGAKITLLPGDTQNKVELGNSEAARLIARHIKPVLAKLDAGALDGAFMQADRRALDNLPRRQLHVVQPLHQRRIEIA